VPKGTDHFGIIIELKKGDLKVNRNKRRKEMKSLELFKKGFRKNEIVIYAIALMLVTAGYFNYSANLQPDSLEVASDVAENVSNSSDNEEGETKETTNIAKEDNSNEKAESIGDAKLVSNNEITKESEDNKENEQNGNEKEKTDGETAETNTEEKSNDDYFINTKLERDTNYANMISTYTKILQDNSISETQKSIAMKEITKINNKKNAISVCENVLSTKDLKNFVVLVNEDSVNIVVDVDGELTKEKVAQIQNVVSRELNSEIKNIHIMEKNK